ncbi:Pectinesterase, catalytic [Corchorus capsularis]|uniref:Pectinesterase, catalytic n=1 Tax=Corchorus capsularis TaxID=210143 RepID=A0A1R3K000_COCAP|nr:Pectinesterase, catalytic [Corchorus capsularis]
MPWSKRLLLPLLFLITLSLTGQATPKPLQSHFTKFSRSPLNNSPSYYCKDAPYISACETVLLSLKTTKHASPKFTPKQLFDPTLQFSLNHAEMARAHVYGLSLSYQQFQLKNKLVLGAMNDCMELLDDTIELLSNVINGSNTNPSTHSFDDVQTWLSAALTNQETCIQSLQNHKLIMSTYSENTSLLGSLAQNLVHYITNSLALHVSSMKPDMNPEGSRRRLLLSSDSNFPSWVSKSERKLLEASVEEIVGWNKSNTNIKVAVVAKDGSGTHKTIGEAVFGLLLKDGNNGRTVIHVKAGTYHENLKFSTKQKKVMLIGDGKGKSVIVSDRNSEEGWTTFQSATVDTHPKLTMASQQQIDIVMIPMMAHGHLIPFLALAKQIHHRTGFTIAIVNTPLNIQYLRSALHKDPTPGITLAELPFNSADHGLPPNTESTENLPLDLIGNFFASSVSLKAPFHNFMLDILQKQTKRPLCIISDVFFGWTVDVAKILGILNYSFTTGGAYGTLAYVSLWLNLPHRQTDSEEFSLPGFPQRCRFHVSHLHRFLRNADGTDIWSRFFQPQISSSLQSSGWLCNTAEEIEPFGLDLLRKYIKLPVWTIGPILPKPLLTKSSTNPSNGLLYKQHAGKEPGISPEKCLQWLDLQGTDSVLYISFGSQNTISASHMIELAFGLEESGNPFIWVIRPPIGFDMKAEFRAEWLPEGFEERMSESKQGLLVKNWAPQLEILSHESTGAFLSHCGWNSTLESLSQGVRMIGWPMAAEQGYNSKMLVEEMGVAVELTRGLQSSISREQVKKVIQMVMDKQGKGGDMKKKAQEIAKHIRAAVREEGKEKGSSIQALDDFISTIIRKNEEL